MQCCIISMIGNAACVDWCCGQTPCHGISMNSEQWTTEQPLPRHLVSDKSENVPRFLCHGVAHLNGISATKIKERQRQSWNSTLQVGCSCTKVLVCKSCLFTGPRCLWGPVYGSRCLYVPPYNRFVKLCWCDSGWWWYQLNTIDDANLKRSLAIPVSYTHLTLPTTPYV